MACMLHKSLGFIRKIIWLSWFFEVGFLGPAVFARVTHSEGKVQGPNSSSPALLCISECTTCPAISSPPTPPLLTSSQAPPPPPKSQAPPPPPSLAAQPSSSPSSHSPATAPPPPPSSTAQPTVISRPPEYSYPYYHFYSSDAASLPAYAPFFMALSFLHCLIFCL